MIRKAKTILSLGLLNLFRVLWYRISIILRFNRVVKMNKMVPVGPFYKKINNINIHSKITDKNIKDEIKLFSYYPLKLDKNPPDWFKNQLTGEKSINSEKEWWNIPDFDNKTGDIKLIWELSRYDWVLVFAQNALKGKKDSIDILNIWLNDWCEKNPPYYGHNWKCAQEASIRVIHLLIASFILKQNKNPAKGLIELIYIHLCRIEPTISYSKAQDNNHATSEGAALFMGGSWLYSMGISKGKKWALKGRRLLENRVKHLVFIDGSFSQYSINYHRVLLDTLSIVEIWRRQYELNEFSILFMKRAIAATSWLFMMVDPDSGDAPNIGANDGARFIPLTQTDYRDYRPSVQLAMALFTGCTAYHDNGIWNDQLTWLDISIPEKIKNKPLFSIVLKNGGYVVIKRNGCVAIMRFPCFKFRPNHADALHLDFWKNGINILRDSGTYSYNTDSNWLDYFQGTVSHNTVQFDNRNQMPRISRFLYGEWLKTETIEPLLESQDESYIAVSYCDNYGVRHKRSITLYDNAMIIKDEVSGFKKKAVLRWRLSPGNWQKNEHFITDNINTIKVSSDVNIIRSEIIKGWESRYYYQIREIPVFEIEISNPGIFISEFKW